MILIDERVGSKELLDDIRKYGVDADICGQLASDFQFCGNGPDGAVLCGFERKELQDLVSSMREKRLAGSQAKPMIDTYDRRYIIVEGIWRRGPDTGLVETLQWDNNGQNKRRMWKPIRGNVRFAEVSRFLSSMREFGDFIVWRTSSIEETASYVAEEYYWWSKEWDEHKTHRSLYAPQGSKPISTGHKPATLWRTESPLMEKWLAQLPGIDSRAEEIMRAFKAAGKTRTVDMVLSNVSFWESIKGIGHTTAKRIVDEICKELD